MSEVTREQADKLENYVLALGIRGYKKWSEKWVRVYRGMEAEKIQELNEIREILLLRMEVPCCGGLEYAATKAIRQSGKFLPWHIVTISIDGKKINN